MYDNSVHAIIALSFIFYSDVQSFLHQSGQSGFSWSQHLVANRGTAAAQTSTLAPALSCGGCLLLLGHTSSLHVYHVYSQWDLRHYSFNLSSSSVTHQHHIFHNVCDEILQMCFSAFSVGLLCTGNNEWCENAFWERFAIDCYTVVDSHTWPVEGCVSVSWAKVSD